MYKPNRGDKNFKEERELWKEKIKGAKEMNETEANPMIFHYVIGIPNKNLRIVQIPRRQQENTNKSSLELS